MSDPQKGGGGGKSPKKMGVYSTLWYIYFKMAKFTRNCLGVINIADYYYRKDAFTVHNDQNQENGAICTNLNIHKWKTKTNKLLTN